MIEIMFEKHELKFFIHKTQFFPFQSWSASFQHSFSRRNLPHSICHMKRDIDNNSVERSVDVMLPSGVLFVL